MSGHARSARSGQRHVIHRDDNVGSGPDLRRRGKTICTNERIDGHAITGCENLGVLALSDNDRRSALRRPARGALRTSRRRGNGDPRVWLRRGISTCSGRAKRSRLHRRTRRRSRLRLAGYVRRSLERIGPRITQTLGTCATGKQAGRGSGQGETKRETCTGNPNKITHDATPPAQCLSRPLRAD